MEFKKFFVSMRFILSGLFVMWSLSGMAQVPESASTYTARSQNRITQIKIAKLTNDMKLSKAQAEKFWPIYNEFDNKRININREIRQLSRNISEDDNPYKGQEKILKLKQERLDLIRQYKPSFLKVITEKQYGLMIASEENFNQTLLEKLKERNQDE